MSLTDQQRIETAADNCEVLRARLAKYEDADGNPLAALKQPSAGVDERAAFETWYLGHFYMGDKQCGLEWLSTEPCGGYRHQHPAEQWIVWQARAALSAPSHGEQVRDNRAEFKREERYMVVKLSKLADDLGGDELSREEQIYRLAHFGKALVECVVVESDWPEYEPTWAAIKARVTGSIASNQLPGGWAAKPTDDGEGFIISSPRVNGVASHFSVFPDSKDYASCALWKMLAAAPSAGSQGGDV